MSNIINLGACPKRGRILKTSEAAKAWNISRWTIYKLVEDERLTPIKGFREWRFYENDIHEPGVLMRLGGRKLRQDAA